MNNNIDSCRSKLPERGLGKELYNNPKRNYQETVKGLFPPLRPNLCILWDISGHFVLSLLI